jgi:glycosidase
VKQISPISAASRLSRKKLVLIAVVGVAFAPRLNGEELPPTIAQSPDARVAAAAASESRSRDSEVPSVTSTEAPPLPNVPAWAVDAVYYQIFPERFRNGDHANDPTHASLEFPDLVPKSWTISPWTGDWYARAAWEREAGDNFFENGVFNRRYGGDLQGVLDKLDYLERLGVTAIYFNPVFYGRSLHKYDGASMHHIDPYFGPDPAGDLKLIAAETSDPKTWHWTAADKLFLKLLDEAHRRGIRIIIDGVFNHTGRDFFAFDDLRDKQADSAYTDWYIVAHFDDPDTTHNEFQYKGWWNVDTLPEFANNSAGDDLHPGPKQYVMDITARWMDPDGDGDPGDGIDGWRLDVAEEVPPKFWKQWNARVRRLNPEAYTVAEVWNDAREFLVGGGFSATMNYHAFAFPAKGFLVDGRMSAHDFGRELALRRAKYPPAMQFALQNLVDSHDTDRLASMIVNRPKEEPYLQPDRFDYDTSPRVSPRHNDKYSVRQPNEQERRLQRMVVLLQMTYLGAPMVYYGDEAGLWGGDDPCDRWPMLWDDLGPYEPQAADPLNRPRTPDEMSVDATLLAFYRNAIALRRDHPVLRRGSCATVHSDDNAQFYAFRRELDGKQMIVAFNRGEDQFKWTPGDAPELSLAFTTDPLATIEAAPDGQPVVVLPGLSAVVLAVE